MRKEKWHKYPKRQKEHADHRNKQEANKCDRNKRESNHEANQAHNEIDDEIREEPLKIFERVYWFLLQSFPWRKERTEHLFDREEMIHEPQIVEPDAAHVTKCGRVVPHRIITCE